MYQKYEAFTYQLKPEHECDSPSEYYTGNVFSSKWIFESIAAKKFLPANTSLLGFNKNGHKRTLPKEKVAYTMTEILAMLEIVKKAKGQFKSPAAAISVKSLKFWKAVEKKNIIPDRSAESLRMTYKKYQSMNEVDFIKHAITKLCEDKVFMYSH